MARQCETCGCFNEHETCDPESVRFAQVRRFMVHDDTHGGYRNVVIGYWDARGWTWCLDHAPDYVTQDGYPIAGDNSAAEGCTCDSADCGVSLLAAAIERRANRKPFLSTCPAPHAPALVA